jgi:hypothetical protein
MNVVHGAHQSTTCVCMDEKSIVMMIQLIVNQGALRMKHYVSSTTVSRTTSSTREFTRCVYNTLPLLLVMTCLCNDVLSDVPAAVFQ